MQSIGRQAAIRLTEEKVKIAVVDPVMAGGVVNPILKNSKWIPIIPATDGAFGMAVIQWIIENKKYDENFLNSPSFDSAKQKGYNGWSNASHLVIVDSKHPNKGKMLRAEDLGFEVPEDEKNPFISIDKGSIEPKLAKDTKDADIYFDGKIQGKDNKSIQVKTAFLMLKESADRYTLDEYSKACGVDKNVIIDIAKEFTSHGTRVSADGLGGTATANGLDLSLILNILPVLVGSMNKKGGIITRRVSYKTFSDGPRYKLSEIEGKPDTKGLRISRTGIRYESTDEYKEKVARGENPYPSRLPWHPIGSASDNQMLFSVVNQYPYSAKIFVNWMANPLLAIPGAARKEVMEALKKPEIVPLFISVDAYMGETTALADYIVPDTTSYESWGLANIEGNFSGKGITVRWPVVKPATMKLEDGRYASYENFLIDVAKAIGLPGFGENSISDINGNKFHLNDASDYFLKGIANIAYDDEPVADITQDEIDIQDLDITLEDWKNSLTSEEWKKAMYIISRGGRFEPHGSGFDGDNRKYINSNCFTLYSENLATSRNSFSGKPYEYGVPTWNPESFINGTPVKKVFNDEEWPFRAANYKAKFRSISMLSNSHSLRDINLKNKVEINIEDAKALGIKTGDRVKVIPATGGEFEGVSLVRQGIAKGTIGIAFGYGHWEYGAKSFAIKGQGEYVNKDIGMGCHLMNLIDPNVEGIFGLSEASTGGPGRNGGAYRIEKL